MQTEKFELRTRVEAPADFVFEWLTRPATFPGIMPPWAGVRILEREGGVTDGARIVMLARVGPMWRHWEAVHQDYIAGRRFCDLQTRGPFPYWKHTHRITPDGDRACYIEDEIDYGLPFGPLGRLGRSYARRQLERVFSYRHRVSREQVLAHWKQQTEGAMHAAPLKIALTGSRGMIGGAVAAFLESGGHEVTRIVRPSPGSKFEAGGSRGPREVLWDPAAEQIDAARLEGLDAVIHLAGENIAGGRWTKAQKAKILASRVGGTQLLSDTLARLEQPPKVFVSASAIGYYGDRGDERLDESSTAGTNFLADVCRQWEGASRRAADRGVRVVNTRFGVVLSTAGGALQKMLLPFKMGLGGRVGSGKQFWSWIALDDVVGAVHHAVVTEQLVGPVNVVSPQPATNLEFTKALGRVLHRPTLFPMPAFAARLALGEMADELLLASARVLPMRLADTNYAFRYPELTHALGHLLGATNSIP